MQSEEERLKVVKELRKQGIEPYGGRFERTHNAAELKEKYSMIEPDTRLENERVSLAGRILSIREHGKLIFIDLKDESGQIQVYASADAMGQQQFDFIKTYLGSGDFIGVRGGIIKTKRGELSVLSKEITLLTKSLLTLPSSWFGLKDIEARYRQRYLDLLMNPQVKKTFGLRAKIIHALREFLINKGFIEVHTPVLQPLYGGANARPFTTYHNELKSTLYLRIAPELYLKKLIVGGFEKVFEIGENFRNEGIDAKHNPEYTFMELYWAYADYTDNMKLGEEMIAYIAKKVFDTTKINYHGKEIDLTPPFERITMVDALKKYAGIDVNNLTLEGLKKIAKEKNLVVADDVTKGELIAALFEELVEYQLIQPTFIYDYPIEVSPLAKKCLHNPAFTERFELYIMGMEIMNAYSELSDPIDQRERFLIQMKKRAAGDEEAHPMDEDFITALKYGMPPTSGLGLGVERLVMLLTNSASIKDVILFPQLRPEVREPVKKEILFGDEEKDRILKRAKQKKQ